MPPQEERQQLEEVGFHDVVMVALFNQDGQTSHLSPALQNHLSGGESWGSCPRGTGQGRAALPQSPCPDVNSGMAQATGGPSKKWELAL